MFPIFIVLQMPLLQRSHFASTDDSQTTKGSLNCPGNGFSGNGYL